jgi:AraC-like DNA-binding protein
MPAFWGDDYPTKSGICISKAGVNVAHDKDFVVDRPHGFADDFIFIHFTSPADILDSLGKRRHGPGACIITAPRTPQWYRNAEHGFTHDWFHCNGPRVRALISDLGIPVNSVFHTYSAEKIEPLLMSILTELACRDRGWQEAVACHAEVLFISLCRSISRGAPRDPRTIDRLRRLEQLRARVALEPHLDWRLVDMAQAAALSPPRFCSAYHKAFGRSPIDDVLNMRMQQARWLLLRESVSVKEVSLQVGFEDPGYFGRIFKKRVGMSPKDYQDRNCKIGPR